jgi:hypothetical protein
MALTPREYALLTPSNTGGRRPYRDACRRAGLPPEPAGYGLLFCEDEDGQRVTIATRDLGYWRMLTASSPELLARLEIPPGKFPWRRAGWPDEW